MKQVFKDHLQAVYTGTGLVKWGNIYTDGQGSVQLESPVQMHAFEVLIFSMVRYNYA